MDATAEGAAAVRLNIDDCRTVWRQLPPSGDAVQLVWLRRRTRLPLESIQAAVHHLEQHQLVARGSDAQGRPTARKLEIRQSANP